MSDASRKAHWETVYATKGENEVSWFQENPAPSLELIDLVGSTSESAIVDIGGGASRLVDSLVARGFNRVTVLDISEAGLEKAKRLAEERGVAVRWLCRSMLDVPVTGRFDLVYSCGAIHHVPRDDRPRLFKRLKA